MKPCPLTPSIKTSVSGRHHTHSLYTSELDKRVEEVFKRLCGGALRRHVKAVLREWNDLARFNVDAVLLAFPQHGSVEALTRTDNIPALRIGADVDKDAIARCKTLISSLEEADTYAFLELYGHKLDVKTVLERTLLS